MRGVCVQKDLVTQGPKWRRSRLKTWRQSEVEKKNKKEIET
jgi:hypothetical protein